MKMRIRNKQKLLFYLLIGTLFVCGCVHNVPLTVDPSKDITHAFPRTKKIPAKVGIYLRDDVRTYVYKQQKIGMTFQMNVGEYVVPISKQMVSAIFDDVTFVDSLPPFKDYYRPDVETVIVPEIIHCYGNAVGTLTGYIEAKVRLRVTAFDLSGKIVWQDEAMGESRSKNLNLVTTFIGGMDEVGRTGYDAAFSTAVKIINNFNARPPKDLYSLVEIKKLETLKNRKNISNSDLFKKYYQKGQYQYERKNYYQAVYSFEKAEQIDHNDPSTVFYIGVCYTYMGLKDKALKKFEEVVSLDSKSQEAKDANKWIETLKQPLKIRIRYSSNNLGTSDKNIEVNKRLFENSLAGQMYMLFNMPHVGLQGDVESQNFQKFLEECYKDDIRVVIDISDDEMSEMVATNIGTYGDFAKDHQVNILVRAYSTRKRALITEFKIAERSSIIKSLSTEQEEAVKQQLRKAGSEKIVLRLLENDIF